MHLTPMRLVTVIAADDLEPALVAALKGLGATGYTVVPARGEGHHGMRTSGLEGGNIRIEVIVDPETADRIVTQLHQRFQPHHALVLYVTTVEVVRATKFGRAGPG